MSGPMQWTPNGLVPAMTMTGGGTIGAAAPQPLDELDDDAVDDEVRIAPAKPIAAKGRPSAKPIKAKGVVQLARARIAEIDRDLKHMKRLEREREELRRLVDAAKAQPRAANVREIKRTAG